MKCLKKDWVLAKDYKEINSISQRQLEKILLLLDNSFKERIGTIWIIYGPEAEKIILK